MELSVTFLLTFARSEDFENTVVTSSTVLLPALPQLSYVVLLPAGPSSLILVENAQ